MSYILIAGEIAAGKTSLAGELRRIAGCEIVSARKALAEILHIQDNDRESLQRLGAELDRRTAGRWLLEYLRTFEAPSVVIDSVRTRRQALPVLERETDSRLVYLTADIGTRRLRYMAACATDPVKASMPFDMAMAHPTEQEVRRLQPVAHLCLPSNTLSPAELCRLVMEEFADAMPGLRPDDGTS